MDIDITTTATIRPEILAQTLDSFRTNLLKGKHNYRLIINIDPIGEKDKTQEDALKVARSFFPNIMYNMPEECSFTKAVIWCWKQAKTNYVFNLEDDWCLLDLIDIDYLLQEMDNHLEYSSFHLNHLSAEKFKILANKDNMTLSVPFTEQRVISLSPSFFRLSYIETVRNELVSYEDPEKQLNKQGTKEAKQASYTDRNYERIAYDIGRKWTHKYNYTKWPKSLRGSTEWLQVQPNTMCYIKQIGLCAHLSGDVAECGTYRGSNLRFFANKLFYAGPGKKIHAFDSFCGFPKDAVDKIDLSRFDDVDHEKVIRKLECYSNIVVHKGLFEDTLSSVSDLQFCCVILDCNLYESYKICMTFFYPRLVNGGVMILDEYYSKRYPLARVAVDDFFADKPEKPEMFHLEDNGWERWRVVKQL
ncbi:hypothetical protein LCGC14_1592950 [marine sediment metagenome]|uniref:Macrocin O-methyltransferase n=1 Tax=marine sediment metagenome TaxID=412755 RepID=A0A0F9IDE7_9ZZZZ